MKDLTDVNLEAQARFGEQIPVCAKSTYNPTAPVKSVVILQIKDGKFVFHSRVEP